MEKISIFKVLEYRKRVRILTVLACLLLAVIFGAFIVQSNGKKTQAADAPTFVKNFGSYGTGDGQFMLPTGIAVDSSGNVYVCNKLNTRIDIFTSDGVFIRKFPVIANPAAVAVAGDGKIYVAFSYDSNEVAIYSNAGVYLGQLGASDNHAIFYVPYGITIDSNGRIFVAQFYAGHFISEFAADGSFIRDFGSDYITRSFAIAAGPDNKIYVVDQLSSTYKIKVFDSDGNYLSQFAEDGTGAGQLRLPSGIAVDTMGNVYVTDQSTHKVVVYESDGTYLTQFGSVGAGDGQFATPWGIGVGKNGRIYIAEYHNNRVSVFQSNFCTITAASGLGSIPAYCEGKDVTIDGATVYADKVKINQSDNLSERTECIDEIDVSAINNSSPAGVAIDASKVYVLSTTQKVIVFDHSGNYLYSFDVANPAGGAPGITVGHDGTIYVGNNGGTMAYNNDGSNARQFANVVSYGMDTGSNGDIYMLTHFGNSGILVYGSDGTLKRTLGATLLYGNGLAIALDADNNMYTTDNAVTVRVIGIGGGTLVGEFNTGISSQWGIEEDGGTIYVSSLTDNSIRKYFASGAYQGNLEGNYAVPMGMRKWQNDLYIADMGHQRIAIVHLGQQAVCDTKRQFRSLTIKNSGVLTHEAVTVDEAANQDTDGDKSLADEANSTARFKKVDLDITGALTLESGGKIDVSGKGYPGGNIATAHLNGYGPGAGGFAGHDDNAASGGGGYGGDGGSGWGKDANIGVAGRKYADEKVFDFGSGSGAATAFGDNQHDGTPGGGRIKILSHGSISVGDGKIIANGIRGTRDSSGGGTTIIGGSSGGMIYIQYNSIDLGSNKLPADISGPDGRGSEYGVIIADVFATNSLEASGGTSDGGPYGGGGIIVIKKLNEDFIPSVTKVLSPVSRGGVANTTFDPYALQKEDVIHVSMDVSNILAPITLNDTWLSEASNYCEPIEDTVTPDPIGYDRSDIHRTYQNPFSWMLVGPTAAIDYDCKVQ